MSKAVGKILQVAALVVAVVAAIPSGGLSLATAAWINIGITAASILNAALLPKDRGPARAASETTLQLGETPRVAIFGEAAIAGSLVDAFNYGGKYGTDWEVVIIALADHRCEGLTGFYVNDRYYAFAGDGPVAGFNSQLQVHFRPGTMTQTLPAIVTANGPGWTAASNGAGVAYVVVAYKADDPEAKNPVWPGGRPRFLWVVKGARCYIPRKDSSVGGAGAHRRNDPSTWEWTDNLIDCRYNWVRGIYAGDQVSDPTQLLVGRGLTAEEAPPENTFAPANLCDELVGGEKRYRVAGSVAANERYLDVEERFAAACGGILVQREGSVEIEPGQAKAAVAFITDADVLVGSTVEYTDYLSEADREWVNTVIPRYVEPSQKWADHAAPIRRETADIIADGGPREETLSLSMVRHARQAGAVGEQFRRLGRLWRRGKVTLGPRFAGIEEGDWIVWTSARRTNSISRVFRVQAYGLDGRWQNTLQLREIATSVFAETPFLPDQSAQDQGLAPPAIGAPGPTAWTLTAVSLDGESGSFPALRIVGAVDDDKARGIRIEYILDPGSVPGEAADWVQDGLYGATLQRRDIAGIAPQNAFYVAISYLVDGVPGDRRVLGPVTTPAVSSTATYADGSTLDEVRDELIGRLTAVEAGIPGLSAELLAIGDDSVLSIDEKSKRLIQLSAELENTWTILDAQAAAVPGTVTTVATARSNAATARTNWLNYRNGLSPAWNDTTTQTAINRATYNGLLNTYTQSLTALAQALRLDAATRADWANVTGKDAVVAQINASTAELARIASDGWLHRSEKQDVIIRYEALVERLNSLVNQFFDQGSPADAIPARDAAGAAIYAIPQAPNSIGSYLVSLSPPYTDRTQDTPVVASTWDARWKAAYAAVEAFQAALVGSVYQDLQSAISAAGGLGDDGVLSAYEKSTILLPTYNQLEATWTLLDGRAAAITGSAVVTSARTGASTARTQFVNYLTGLTPSGLTPGVDSPVDRATYRSRLESYGNALTALADALRVYVDARATTALDRIAVYENNGILDRTEKWSLVNDWQSLNREFEAVNAAYLNQGQPSQATAAQVAAFNALGPLGSPAGSLGAYLGGLSPSWLDSNVDTPLDRDTLSVRWQDCKAKIEAFRAAMNAPRNADNTAAVVGNRLSQVDANGRGTSRRLNSMYALGGAQQVYIPTSGNTNVGGTIAANVPGSPVWAYHDGNGSTATIQVFPHLLIDDAGTLTFGGGFLFGAAFNAIYWIYDDSGYVSGNPTYGFTTNANDLNAPNRRLVGSVVTPGPGTPAGGGVSGGGGGGGGIRERYYPNQLTDIP